ncbi:MAG: alpha/beta hydrolase [Bowdeniella nasicola]|nr:alpha/beta hydrolase [Bowdeniella nasicola]
MMTLQTVFLHGLNNDSGVWAPVSETLAEKITSTALMLPPLSDIDEIADWVADQYEGAALLVGHSFGGAVVQAVLDRHPDKVRGLVLVNASVRADSAQGAENRRAKAAGLASEADYRAMATGSPDRLYAPRNATNPEILQTRKESVAIYGLERFTAHSQALASRPDRTEAVANAEVPVLVVAADGDVVITTDSQRSFAQEVGAQFEVIAHTGHMLPAEEPEKLGQVIGDFISANFATEG